MLKTCGFATVAVLMVFGQVAPAELPIAQWSQAGAVGLMMFLLYSIVVKQQPKERKERKEEDRKERTEAREHTERVVQQIGDDFKAVQKQQHEDSQAVVSKIGKLAENCAAHLARDTTSNGE